jgi:hypothetical protein
VKAAVAALALVLAAHAHAADELQLPPVTRVTLDNGLRLVIAEYHELPLVEFHVIVGAGSAQDPAGKEGLAALTASTLDQGAGHRFCGRARRARSSRSAAGSTPPRAPRARS